jgi:hypothetical protein
MKRLHTTYKILLGCLMAFMALRPGPSPAQEAIKVLDQGSTTAFRDHVTFTLTAESSAEIVAVDLFYKVVGQIATSRNEAEFSPGTSISAEFVIDQTESANYSPPGTEIEYWWRITDAAGNELKTERERLLYLDDRYPWQTRQNERLTLYWYEGDQDFGQSLFERANTALDTLETDIGIALEEPIKIFIYGSHNDLLGALRASAQEWTGGVAFTEFGVVLIGVHPRQLNWGLNAMTHEMTHLVIHQATANPFGDLPRWLDEGIAVYNENRNELDQDFRPIFERAVADNELMTLRTLSSPFPSDPLLANLAYGQSGAIVKFVVDTYGSEAMANLLDIFAEGALYDEALEQALGVNTDQLDNQFRLSLGMPPLPGLENEVVANEAAAVPAQMATEEAAETSESVAATAEAVVEEAPVAAEPNDQDPVSLSGAAAEGGDEASAETAPAAPQRNPVSISCLTGLIAALFAGTVIAGRRHGWPN